MPAELPAPAVAPPGIDHVGTARDHHSAVARFYGVTIDRERWLLDALRGFQPDAVLAFGYDVAPYMARVCDELPVVFDLIDSDILHFSRQITRGEINAANVKNLAAAFLAGRKYLRRCDALITVSEEDTRSIR